MFSVFNTALSGLSAVATAVDVVGNNLANLNTVGFKASTVSFQDLMDQQLGMGQTVSSAVGMGVSSVQAVHQFNQGNLQQTTGAFDAAIQGQGFFVVRDTNNQQLYTRAGDFTVDTSGHLVTSTGQFVQGWTASGGTVNANAAPGDITVPLTGVSGAKATGTMSMAVNLNADAVKGDATGTYSAPIQVVDSLGATHTLTATFTKSDTNKWDYSVTIPASDLQADGKTEVAKGSVTFDSNGQLKDADPAEIDLAGLANGADEQKITWNLMDGSNGLITQFSQKSGVSATNQDGTQAGQITSVGLADGGFIVAHYSSGQDQTIGQIAMATISNPESLTSVGNNNLAATTGTAQAAIGAAGSGGRGNILANQLETSTVDIAKEFTNLITFQRSYSANSRVITTSDEMLQDLLNVKR